MQESVVYQRIIRQGIEQGRKEEALSVVLRLLTRRIGIIAPELRRRTPTGKQATRSVS
ncbi:MAG: DUF4351 domain-containing protein [Nostoc sp. DcaGUA01]|nr:DUF4351 domain-containing protein [Nostoc sp. SerVER01]MDZ8028566.1 DUF4351 domain-containing protein [Nostoc sp. DedQUE11]MDZ8074177.1 DUF4351 domain-containing protein [Nostoc sp. DedQUE01]MDZ8081603.1 DUF4351 domain-containing protein [Nostoc sp. DcaGUA01]